VETAGIYGEAYDELAVGLSAREAHVLESEVDGHGIGDLILETFEDRDLAFDAGGFFPDVIDVRREVAERA
jgi:hypothetical protein